MARNTHQFGLPMLMEGDDGDDRLYSDEEEDDGEGGYFSPTPAERARSAARD